MSFGSFLRCFFNSKDKCVMFRSFHIGERLKVRTQAKQKAMFLQPYTEKGKSSCSICCTAWTGNTQSSRLRQKLRQHFFHSLFHFIAKNRHMDKSWKQRVIWFYFSKILSFIYLFLRLPVQRTWGHHWESSPRGLLCKGFPLELVSEDEPSLRRKVIHIVLVEH